MMQQPNLKPREIANLFEVDYGLRYSYTQTWKVKEQATRKFFCSPIDSYNLIPWLCKRMLDVDEHTDVKWTATDNNGFSELFVAYGPSIVGFRSGCRPVLYIDGTFLKGPYKGTFLSVCAFDGDNQIVFPCLWNCLL